MSNKVLKVGIIGPRTFALGGHDLCNPIRMDLRLAIRNFLNEQKKKFVILGITGLDVGTEQDFALSCIECEIDFTCYVSCSDFEIMPEGKALYDELYEKANSRIILSDGEYSPKKTISKNKRIIHDSDHIIYVSNPMRRFKCPMLSLIKELKKDILVIKPKVKLLDA